MTPDQERRLELYRGSPEAVLLALSEHDGWVEKVLEGLARLRTGVVPSQAEP